MHLSNPLVRLGFGLVAIFALAMVVVSIGMNSDSPSASAVGPTPTKIDDQGPSTGLNDVLVHGGAEAVSLFYCIGYTTHQVNGVVADNIPDAIKTSLQCNIDTPGQGSTAGGETPNSWCQLGSGTFNPLSDPDGDCNAADLSLGPPPPPPFTTLTPSKGFGFYYHDGDDPDGFCAGSPCTVTASCFEDLGSPEALGPNLISIAILFGDATDTNYKATGTVDIHYNQNNDDCKAGTPAGAPDFDNLPLTSWQVTLKDGSLTGEVAPWRPTDTGCATGVPCVTNFDGDACDDADELNKTSEAKCGDDPQNPSDSFFDADTVDLSGDYGIGVRAIRNDCTDGTSQATCIATHVTGFYFSCIADLQHDLSDNSIVIRPYCYIDLPGLQINPEAYPGASGDGAAGGSPPGPQVAPHISGFLSWAYGDIDLVHTELNGTFNKVTNNIEFSGCFIDQDGFGGLGNVYVEGVVSAHQLLGSVDVYSAQAADCAGSPTGNASTNVMSLTKTRPDKPGLDSDGDGVSNAAELTDLTPCGRRDPYNKNDYYDVSIPRDSVIDLSNDILGVITHYSPGGYIAGTPDLLGGIPLPTNFDNFDRPPTMAGAGFGSTWNRGSGDGVIDLSNDILGVILQYNPGGC